MRVMCYRCFWPESMCWCSSITPIDTRTRFVFLMHPKEFKHEKAATGRLTHLCLRNSEVHMGVGFDLNERVQSLIADPANLAVLLYPGREAIDLSQPGAGQHRGRREFVSLLGDRIPVVFVLDATWSLGRKMLRLSPTLQGLPRIMFTPSAPSRYIIKQQPNAGCLSTLEATHELLTTLAGAGIDHYARPEQLLRLFDRMQEVQLRCAADPARPGYRRRAYRAPSERTASKGRSGARRAGVFQSPLSSERTPDLAASSNPARISTAAQPL